MSELRITSFDTHYNHTIPSVAGRELQHGGRTVHLASIDVEVRAGDGTDGETFAFRYDVDQEEDRVALATAESKHSETASVPKLAAAAAAADDAVHDFIMSVGLDFMLSNRLTSPGVTGRAMVATDLEVDA